MYFCKKSLISQLEQISLKIAKDYKIVRCSMLIANPPSSYKNHWFVEKTKTKQIILTVCINPHIFPTEISMKNIYPNIGTNNNYEY